MFSSTNSRRPGVVSADSSARSYWPSTRWPMNPSRSPSWRVVTQRLASVIVALVTPLPGGQHLVQELALEAADQPGEGRRVGADPGRRGRRRRRGPRRPAASVPRCSRQGRHDARHRGGVVALRRPELVRGRASPGADRRRAIAMSSTRRQSTSPAARADRSIWRPATVTAAPSTEPTRNPTCHRRSSGIRAAPRRVRAPRRAAISRPPRARRTPRPGRTRRTSATRSTGTAPRRRSSAGRGPAARRSVSAGREWPAAPGSAAVPRVVPGASSPFTESSSASVAAVAVAESTIATRSPTARVRIGRSSG